MTSDLDAINSSPTDPGGGALATVGNVLAVNPGLALVQVSVYGSDGTWVPAVASRYRVGGKCQVLLNPFAGGRSTLVAGAVDPVAPVAVTNLVGAPDDPSNTATIVWPGGQLTVPFIPSAVYPAGGEVWVSLDDWGRPVLVLGPSDEPAPPPPPAPPAAAPTGGTRQEQVTILPQWSGSYRFIRGAWDRWNTGSYGGRSTLYQGDGFGSGPMKGLAVYGDQFVNLGAVSIDRVRVRARGVGLSGATGPAVFQSSPHGSPPGGAPASSGATFAAGADGWADADATTREELRTGAKKGFATVGGNYWAVAGAGNGDGMAVDVLYTRPA